MCRVSEVACLILCSSPTSEFQGERPASPASKATLPVILYVAVTILQQLVKVSTAELVRLASHMLVMAGNIRLRTSKRPAWCLLYSVNTPPSPQYCSSAPLQCHEESADSSAETPSHAKLSCLPVLVVGHSISTDKNVSAAQVTAYSLCQWSSPLSSESEWQQSGMCQSCISSGVSRPDCLAFSAG